jgi:hypothetical protein
MFQVANRDAGGDASRRGQRACKAAAVCRFGLANNSINN